jgi:hypothetical protein
MTAFCSWSTSSQSCCGRHVGIRFWLWVLRPTDEMMRARSQDSIFDVTRQVPNVEIRKGAGPEGSTVSAFIRGIGQSDFNCALRWLPTDNLAIDITGDLTNDKSEAVASTLIDAPTFTALGPIYRPCFVPPNKYTTYETSTDSVGAFTGQPFSTPPINHCKGSGAAATVEYELMEGLSLEPSLHTGNLRTTSPLRPTVPPQWVDRSTTSRAIHSRKS